ncbi:MAG: transcription antitermination factor NusB [Chloroflexi bacterium]|nr:transcription antitermination factor NusB [Chloroflexota bacterium]
MSTGRRQARTIALQVLYEVDATAHDWRATLDRAVQADGVTEDGAVWGRVLVEGVKANQARIDALIQEYAPAWPLEQVSSVGRNILRIAIFEILMNNETPPKVAVNEAVELAKIFGSENLHKFVNGVLGSIMATARA